MYLVKLSFHKLNVVQSYFLYELDTFNYIVRVFIYDGWVEQVNVIQLDIRR